MTENIEIIYAGKYELSAVQPIFKSSSILMPIDARVINTDKYDGDAMSFGYPVDEGYCTVVSYNTIVGTLADDTIDLVARIKEETRLQRLVRGAISYHSFDVIEVDESWRPTDESWIDQEIDDRINKKLLTKDEANDHRTNALSNYNCWPQHWRDAYDAHVSSIHDGDLINATPVATNKSTKLFKDAKGYYFSSPYYCHGQSYRVTDDSASDFMIAIERHNIIVERLTPLESELKSNLSALSQL